MSNSLPQCGTCKFWARNDESYNEIIDAKTCNYVPHAEDTMEWNEEYERVLTPAFKDQKAFVTDGSGYAAALYTKADFGCNQHQEGKENE